jgi:hypothetical protein
MSGADPDGFRVQGIFRAMGRPRIVLSQRLIFISLLSVDGNLID